MYSIILRVLIIYLIVLLVLRLMGKRQLGEMQPFEFVITLIIADLATIPMTEHTIPIFNGIIPVLTLLIIHYTISLLARKSLFIRRIVTGKPVIVISPNGIEYENLKNLNMNLSDLAEMLRTANCNDMSQIAYAIVETNGKVNVILKTQNSPATLEDLKIQKDEKASIFSMLICDFKLVKQNISNFNLTPETVLKMIADITKKQATLKDVVLFSMDENGNYYLQLKGADAQDGTIEINKGAGIQP